MKWTDCKTVLWVLKQDAIQVAPAKLEIHLALTMSGFELNIGIGRGQTPNYICCTQLRGLVKGQAVCCRVLMTLFKAVKPYEKYFHEHYHPLCKSWEKKPQLNYTSLSICILLLKGCINPDLPSDWLETDAHIWSVMRSLPAPLALWPSTKPPSVCASLHITPIMLSWICIDFRDAGSPQRENQSFWNSAAAVRSRTLCERSEIFWNEQITHKNIHFYF